LFANDVIKELKPRTTQ